MSALAAPVLDVSDLRVDYRVGRGVLRRGTVLRAVAGVSLSIGPGETLGLVGESGCGKSTVARAVMGLARLTGGTIRVAGRNLAEADPDARRRVQMVFQDPYSSLDPRQRVGDAVREPLDIHGRGSPAERDAATVAMLRLVGLDGAQARRFPHQFSGGQRQRIGIARALVAEPDLLVCDEPVSALDVSVQAQVLNLLVDLQKRLSLSMLFIAHDLAVVRHVAARIAVMYLGRIVEQAPRDDLFAEPLHPYSRALLSAAPIPNPKLERARQRIVLSGEAPSPLSPPKGCGFRTRCPLAQPLCEAEVPRLETVGVGRTVACHYWRDSIFS